MNKDSIDFHHINNIDINAINIINMVHHINNIDINAITPEHELVMKHLYPEREWNNIIENIDEYKEEFDGYIYENFEEHLDDSETERAIYDIACGGSYDREGMRNVYRDGEIIPIVEAYKQELRQISDESDNLNQSCQSCQNFICQEDRKRKNDSDNEDDMYLVKRNK